MLQLVYVGGLGLMAGPAGTHLKPDGPATVLRVHDRGTPGAQKDAFRAAWRAHGAELVGSFDAVVGDGQLDGVVVCVGKNGDDVQIIAELAHLLQARCTTRPFIMHMSTVSAGFTVAAHAFCTQLGVGYVNYPLTGGPLGAQLGGGHPNGMLILASGDQGLYERLEPTLKVLGRPKYFSSSVSAGAETKLIGQHLVFDGCTGICTGAALYAECFEHRLQHPPCRSGCDLCRQTRPRKRLATLLHPTHAKYRPGVCLRAAEISADGCRHARHCARIDRQSRSGTRCVHERTRRFWHDG